jgi:hypothetical protein
MYAVLQWNHDDPWDAIPMVIAERLTEEQANVTARMNMAQYHRKVITTEELADMRKTP